MVDARGLAAEAPRGSFTIEPKGPFSLEASIRFLEGFAPAARAEEPTDRLDMAFALEGSWRTIGVSVDQNGGTVRGRLFAARALTRDEMSAAKSQVLRILSLDVDGGGFAEVGERDPVVGALQERFPGLRPVNFYSWYEAAAWAIIGQRTRMSQAAALKERMAQQLGVPVTVNGAKRYAFPAPRVLQELTEFPGLPSTKVEWLRHLADVARRGTLDSPLLRSMPREEALEALEELPGIGPFSAELILLRGAGEPDQVPSREPRLVSAVQLAYSLPAAPSPDEVEAIADGWAPYRTWVTLLLRVKLELDGEDAAADAGDPGAAANTAAGASEADSGAGANASEPDGGAATEDASAADADASTAAAGADVAHADAADADADGADGEATDADAADAADGEATDSANADAAAADAQVADAADAEADAADAEADAADADADAGADADADGAESDTDAPNAGAPDTTDDGDDAGGGPITGSARDAAAAGAPAAADSPKAPDTSDSPHAPESSDSTDAAESPEALEGAGAAESPTDTGTGTGTGTDTVAGDSEAAPASPPKKARSWRPSILRRRSGKTS